MFLKRLNKIRAHTWLYLTFWYTLLFSFSLLLVAVMVYGVIYRTVRTNYENLIDEKIQAYQLISEKKDRKHLIEILEKDALANAFKGFYLLLLDARGTPLAMNLPMEDRFDHDRGYRDHGEKRGGEEHRGDGESLGKFIPHGDDLLGRTLVLDDGSHLHIGFLHFEAFDFLEFFRDVLLTVLVPILCLGLGGGAFLGYKALKPAQSLVKAIDEIDQGELGTRVPEREGNSELDVLARRFNTMLERIETLVSGLKNTLNNVAHDIRTPLSRMKAVIEQRIQEDDPKILKEALMDCGEEISKVSEMVNTLMDVTQIETGIMTLNPGEFNLAELIDEVLAVYGILAEEKEIKIINEISEEILCYGDRNRLMQVFANLIDNGLKYSDPKAGITISAGKVRAGVRVRVSDTGIGMDEKYLDHIFERLYRIDKSRTEQGHGLGLSIVKAIVDAHGGRIEVSSRKGQGSAFDLTLPGNPVGNRRLDEFS